MKIVTTFWSEEKFEFDKLLYIDCDTNKIIFETDTTNNFATYLFFKKLAKFMQTTKVRKEAYRENEVCYQFAVLMDGKVMPIKWFDIVVDDKITLSHDIAFSTTLVKKNGISQPFGKFPMWYKERLAFYREFNMKKTVYRYFANQVKKAFF